MSWWHQLEHEKKHLRWMMKHYRWPKMLWTYSYVNAKNLNRPDDKKLKQEPIPAGWKPDGIKVAGYGQHIREAADDLREEIARKRAEMRKIPKTWLKQKILGTSNAVDTLSERHKSRANFDVKITHDFNRVGLPYDAKAKGVAIRVPASWLWSVKPLYDGLDEFGTEFVVLSRKKIGYSADMQAEFYKLRVAILEYAGSHGKYAPKQRDIYCVYQAGVTHGWSEVSLADAKKKYLHRTRRIVTARIKGAA